MDYEKAYKAVLQTATQWIKDGCTDKERICLECVFPELRESEDERIRKRLLWFLANYNGRWDYPESRMACRAWLEKQKETPKSADSIPADCTSDAKCGDRWQKVTDSLPDNGRLVLAQDCLGNTLLARYDGEGNWEVSVYDKDDYYCRNTITKWCEIPSEKQKEQKTDAKSEWVIKAARRVLNDWLDGTDCPDVSGDFTELEYAIREYDGEEKQKEPHYTKRNALFDKCVENCDPKTV